MFCNYQAKQIKRVKMVMIYSQEEGNLEGKKNRQKENRQKENRQKENRQKENRV
jgi:hypothetical protein